MEELKKNDGSEEEQPENRTGDSEKAKNIDLKVEMKPLCISPQLEQELFNILKTIVTNNFVLFDASTFVNKISNLNEKYWIEDCDSPMTEAINYDSENTSKTNKREEQIRESAIKLQRYGFCFSHCEEALRYMDNDEDKALNVLFWKYYGINNTSRKENFENVEYLSNKRCEEKKKLESSYPDAFREEKKDCIWIVKLKLNYLENVVGAEFQQDDVSTEEDPFFILEIRFPGGLECKYPCEAPYLFIYKDRGIYPSLECLRIIRRLHREAMELCKQGTPFISSIIELLTAENENKIKSYLEEDQELFLSKYESLHLKELQNSAKIDMASQYEMGSTSTGSREKRKRTHSTFDKKEKKLMKKQTTENYIKMREMRKELPIWFKKLDLIEKIINNQVVIIFGEPGCGKSTQVPQFILDDLIVNLSAREGHSIVICTQSREASVLRLVQRVAAEKNEDIGGIVGYQTHLRKEYSHQTRLKFCTPEKLLQQLLAENKLTEKPTHIIIDDAHERSIESYYLLKHLKKLLLTDPVLKIILMSADKLNIEFLKSYFGTISTILEIQQKTEVTQFFLEDIFRMIKYVLKEDSEYARCNIKPNIDQPIDSELDVLFPEAHETYGSDEELKKLISRCSVCNSQISKNLFLMNHEMINFELIEKTLEWIVSNKYYHSETGSILVFLPGVGEIITLRDKLNSNKIFSHTTEFIIVPLYSEEQKFIPSKISKPRKIILSTNLAETSAAINDCTFVIDTGKTKEMHYAPNQSIERLKNYWILKANALQRKGRAGRVMSGVCIHLYTSCRFERLDNQRKPDILNVSLETSLLRIRRIHGEKQIKLDEILQKIARSRKSLDSTAFLECSRVSNAIECLQNVGAFNSRCMLTSLGHHLAALPTNVRISKLILFGAIFRCLDSALTIAACMSHETPFNINNWKNNSRRKFFTANSDHLTMLEVYKSWLTQYSYNNGESFARQHYLCVQTLHSIADMKYQFLELLVSIGFIYVELPDERPSVDTILEITGSELNIHNENYKLLQALLCVALYPNIVTVLTPEKELTGAMQSKPEEFKFQTMNGDYVRIHPSSINVHSEYFASPYLVFQEKIDSTYIKEVSMIPSLPLIFFFGEELSVELHNNMPFLSLENGWILFPTEIKLAQLLQYMRIELTNLLEAKIQDPLSDLFDLPLYEKVIDTIIKIISE